VADERGRRATDDTADRERGAERSSDYREPAFLTRVVARLVDQLVFIPLAVAVVVLAIRVGPLLSILAGVYEVWLTAWRGQTVGKMFMGVQVVDRSTGGPISPRSSVIRWATWGVPMILAELLLPSAAPFLVIVVFAPILRPPLHRGLHDLTAHTVVTG
jgi:uncharacterized RDD family membrane protein YckC